MVFSDFMNILEQASTGLKTTAVENAISDILDDVEKQIRAELLLDLITYSLRKKGQDPEFIHKAFESASLNASELAKEFVDAYELVYGRGGNG